MQLIDSHCHLDIDAFSGRRQMLLARARSVGVAAFIIPGVDRQGWQRILDLSRSEPGVFAASGLHPMYLANHHPDHLQELRTLIDSTPVVAIGEIGLDYYVPGLDRQVQQQLFEEQLRLAASAALPVLLHVRKAHDQVLATLRRRRFPHGGIVHAYTGSLQQAMQYLDLGFLISICGTITYDRAKRLRGIAAALPPEALAVETDAPDIPLAGHRGEDNLPEYLPEVVAALANLRGEQYATTAAATTANVARLLDLPR